MSALRSLKRGVYRHRAEKSTGKTIKVFRRMWEKRKS